MSDVGELERQLRHASFFTQASLEQHGKLTGQLDVYVTSLIELLLERGVIDMDALGEVVEANRKEQQSAARATYDANGQMPKWPTVMVREDAPPAGDQDDGEGGSADASPEVEVDCAARMHVCKAACCSLPFPLSADEVEAGDVKWDLGHPYVIRQSEQGYCVHNDRESGGCTVYDARPGVCRGYSCAEDDRIWLDFDRMILNEEFLANRRRPDFRFRPASDAVPVTVTPRSSAQSRPAEPGPDPAASPVGAP
jgi:Fe-S-cluster containining protein